MVKTILCLALFVSIASLGYGDVDFAKNFVSKSQDTFQTRFLEIGALGISGRNLLQLFKVSLVDVIRPNVRIPEARVSNYYDRVHDYLFRGALSLPEVCDPDKSVVAQLTRNVSPINIHSHNDYWRDLPLFEAIAHGATSVEADVWLVPNQNKLQSNGFALAVGHDENYLGPVHRTLDKLYTDPLLYMLNEVNCNKRVKKSNRYGLFYDSPDTTIYQFIDFKSSDSVLTYKLLMEVYFKKLIEKDFITKYNLETKQLEWRPITIILTGNYPTDMNIIDNNGKGYFNDTKRYVFQDASLHDIKTYDNSDNKSLIASTSFNKLLNECNISRVKFNLKRKFEDNEMNCLTSLIETAHSKNLQTRIWGGPEWPVAFAKQVWDIELSQLNVDYLNVDDLAEAMKF
ncbi:hypothetical protein Kpol_1054p45 [Vanderwaltozyma polyspora DSM 70294]|uniref:Altered inheritance of mitochondria protein 6 n=1 Tax=Vanderwaltozyma polyspora (strain ATCC 22028 / DSM 70294 / BCRC 21397 / CBS 2163 / NBRC 10782 / NRRL Y-8283 / UCD 57-17) TaxID=436907 RepID=A7TID2_VANPO|nr:uncharacterized protein Kpol_1054p45 [Vanderwaltozyma polyspora DSM 70294]EDO17998.1 hypothetical protein Kpol_1054p45 [Vanderwaltozyma polyspora DSM 70294]